MDREEARELLLGYSRFINEETDLWEALDLAIEALRGGTEGDAESATTTDCISRQEVLGYIDRLTNSGLGKAKSLEYIQKYVERMESSVAPKPVGDYISRQQAIEALDRIGSVDTEADREYARDIFDNLPPVTPTVSEDCISLKWLEENAKEFGGYYQGTVYAVPLSILEDAPSVTPTERTGEWIEDGYYDSPFRVCSHCGYEHPNQQEIWKFCPNCGAKMKGGTENDL